MNFRRFLAHNNTQFALDMAIQASSTATSKRETCETTPGRRRSNEKTDHADTAGSRPKSLSTTASVNRPCSSAFAAFKKFSHPNACATILPHVKAIFKGGMFEFRLFSMGWELRELSHFLLHDFPAPVKPFGRCWIFISRNASESSASCTEHRIGRSCSTVDSLFCKPSRSWSWHPLRCIHREERQGFFPRHTQQKHGG